ncbi:MAG: hypothetical protein CM1200mP39_29160 [Dehalococcoidia bacterium]|nr:MAG: hypothetical protein CM1200mP39_29160 [Dehalococcoidia bacterium]
MNSTLLRNPPHQLPMDRFIGTGGRFENEFAAAAADGYRSGLSYPVPKPLT